MIYEIPDDKYEELVRLSGKSTEQSVRVKSHDLFQYKTKVTKSSSKDDLAMAWARLGLSMGFDWNRVKLLDGQLIEAEPLKGLKQTQN